MWLIPSRIFVRATFRVNSTPVVIAGDHPQFDPNEFGFYKQTLTKLLRSDYLLTAVLRPPSFGSLNVIRRHDDPVDWLKRNLVIDFTDNNQTLTVGLYGSKEDKGELVVLIDTITQRFMSELASRNYQKLTSERDQKIRESDELQKRIDQSTASVQDLNMLRHQRQQLIAGMEADRINQNAESRVVLIEPAASSSK
jgi:hypothetical protein